MNYLDFFKKFYYNDGRKIDKVSIEGNDIIFSEGTKPFYKLCKYNQDLINCIKSAYFDGVEKNDKIFFKTSSQNKINNN